MTKVIKKAVVKVTILFDSSDYSDEYFDGVSLGRLGYEISEGAAIGQTVMESLDIVAPDKVHDELVALANDGTFFSYGEDE